MKDRIVIVVKGGVVQDVLCDKRHNVILVDWDNIEAGMEAGDIFTPHCYPIDVGQNEVDAILEEARNASLTISFHPIKSN